MDPEGKLLMNRYEFRKQLGQGNFAKVYKARDLRTGDRVAVKVIDKEKVLRAGMMVQAKREIETMRRVKHPNVLRLYEVLATKTKIYLILEYAKGGELFLKIRKISYNQARQYFQQLVSALDFCHKKGVYHRDLKPENLLLDENGVLKIADFGFSTFIESHRRNNMLQTMCGTPMYVAPDVLHGKGYCGEKADVWSCGVILYVLMTRYYPFYDRNLMEMYRKSNKGEYKCPDWFSVEIRRLLSQILNPNPDSRISTAKIMESQREITNVAANAESDKAIVENEIAVVEPNQELVQPKYLNAFHILSLSAGLDLSVFFASNNDDEIEDIKFTSKSSASSIISTMEDIAHMLNMKIVKNNGEMLKLEREQDLRKRPLTISTEIFEFAPSFYLVEIKKYSGDASEYQKILKEHIIPVLKDIIWIWQSEKKTQH
ncbi:CBL-interacting kinase [Medicago truncatula]|uniref:non-specific serine/threonine protein kinase n=1 Tax=Medicago truncatula TaxID=3880 RepID=A0A072UZG3_MEDTR|nr:CBL-interacting kinase [Medicago truncatula]